MKKLAGKCLCMAAALAVLLYLLGVVYRVSGAEQRMWTEDGTENFHPVPGNIDVAVFGASHAKHGVRSGPEGHTFFNFALDSQTPQYDLAMMHQYGDHIKENAVVILTVSYTTPYLIESESSFQEKQGRYYRLLDPENIIDVNLAQYYLMKLFPVLGVEPASLISKIVVPMKYTEEATFDKSQVIKQQESIRQRHLAGIESIFPKTVTLGTYAEILSLCAEKNWKAVLVTTPYNVYYNDCFPSDFYPAFHDTVNDFAREHGVPYFDYSHEEEFATSMELYHDIDHLNAAGAAEFETRLYADLQAAGLL